MSHSFSSNTESDMGILFNAEPLVIMTSAISYFCEFPSSHIYRNLRRCLKYKFRHTSLPQSIIFKEQVLDVLVKWSDKKFDINIIIHSPSAKTRQGKNEYFTYKIFKFNYRIYFRMEFIRIYFYLEEFSSNFSLFMVMKYLFPSILNNVI